MNKQIKQDVFNPQSQQHQSSTPYKVPKSRKNSIGKSFGKWSQEQNFHYVLFMDLYQDIFNSRERRRLTRIFRSMSHYIQTRTPIQCRSHHQKLMAKYGSFKKIISAFKSHVGQEYQQRYQEFVEIQKYVPQLSDVDKEETSIEQRSISIQTDPVLVMNASQQTQLAGLNYYLPQLFTAFMGSSNWFHAF